MFFIKQKRAYEMRSRDGSSDVGSSDLRFGGKGLERRRRRLPLGPWDLREAAAAGRRSRGLLAHFSDDGLRAEEDLMAKLLPQPQAVLGFDVCQSPRRRDRKSVAEGKMESVRVDPWRRRLIKKNN